MKVAAKQHIGLNHAGDEFGQSPCGAYLSLSVSVSIPRPHKSSSRPIKALCGQEELVFFPAFSVL